ncbi:Ger(x)C family spore germination protein [Psychrobacillus sp. Sa2BUA9]|uniref:Ger(X)C family spore germination protein n=1 Tax=Psychrobacillus faecigallinarum TaxID=2762235 RepID=A0ABR8R450_9BACI|nr:Ger(x)C family spore germination protein [Psychrobacillus faecigallinarum]MBD7942549.1 Ger(x)C family spore germination protein [Psychrobacillus faecigallinarum]
MKKLSFYLITLFLCIILAGCAETNILDRIGLTTLVGYDIGSEEENIKTTAVIREVSPEFQSNVEVVTAEEATSKGARVKTNRKLSKKIMVGQMRVILFSEEIAKDDIHYFIDAHLENASVSNGVYMAVVEGPMSSLLEYKYENIEDIGQHIYRLLEQNIESEYMISSTLHVVARDYYSAGRNIVMPIIKRDEEFVEISGIAFFKDGNMSGRLSAEDSFFVKIIRDNYKHGNFQTKLKEEDISPSLMKNSFDEIPLAFDTVKTDRKLKLVNSTTPEFDLNITIKGRLLELRSDIDVGNPKIVEELEKGISKNLKKEISRVISIGQKYESDVFGFGESYRSSVRNSKLTPEKWHELFKTMKVNVKVDFKLVRNGVFE